jgi:hypothetical protein
MFVLKMRDPAVGLLGTGPQVLMLRRVFFPIEVGVVGSEGIIERGILAAVAPSLWRNFHAHCPLASRPLGRDSRILSLS